MPPCRYRRRRNLARREKCSGKGVGATLSQEVKSEWLVINYYSSTSTFRFRAGWEGWESSCRIIIISTIHLVPITPRAYCCTHCYTDLGEYVIQIFLFSSLIRYKVGPPCFCWIFLNFISDPRFSKTPGSIGSVWYPPPDRLRRLERSRKWTDLEQ